MEHTIRKIEAWIKEIETETPELHLSAVYIQVISILIIVPAVILEIVYAAAGQFTYLPIISIEVFAYCVVIFLARYGKVKLASYLFLSIALGLLAYGVFIAGGIHASSSILYPVILVFASLLLSRRAYIFYGLICIASIGFIIFAESNQLTPISYKPDPPDFPLFATYVIIIVTVGVIIRIITEGLQNNIRQVRKYAQDLSAQKAMLDRVGQAVIACQTDNTIVYWNQAATDLYGWSADEALNKQYFEIVPSDLSAERMEEIRSKLRKGGVWSGEIKIQKRDKHSLSILATISPLQDEKGFVTGWIGVATDLTERKKVEQIAARKVEEMKLLNQLNVSVAVGGGFYSTLYALQKGIANLIPADAFYVAIYEAQTDIVRYPIFFDEGNQVDEKPRKLTEWPGLTGAVIFSGKTLYIPNMMLPEVDEKFHPYDSNNLYLRTFIGVPLSVNGQVIGMLSVQSKEIDAYSQEQVDLMESVAVQAAIAIDKARLFDRIRQELAERKKAEDKYRNIFNNSIDGIFQSTDNGHFINVNPAMARIYGYDSPEDMLNSVTDIRNQLYVDQDKRDEVRNILAENNQIIGYESLDYRKDGSTFWTSMNIQAIRSENGKVIYYEGTVEDITLRKKAEAEQKLLIQELAHKNAELEQFTYTASHDLKSPLITIGGFLGFLEQDAIAGRVDRVQQDVSRIREAIQKMKRLLDELLELSRIGRMTNPFEVINFEDLVNEATEIVYGRLKERGVVLQVQPNLPIVYGDKQRLLQVLQNLIDNAAKYMGDQPTPKIEIGQNDWDEEMPIFYIKDNGMGVAHEHHERIFGLFNKLDPASEGTGVGLALVKRIIELHGGRIWLQSNLGQGSMFMFTLPKNSGSQ